MPSFNREDKDNLTAFLTVTIPYSEYSVPVNKELNKIRRTASFKGFRAGKTPMSFVKKMYGARILLDELNKILVDSTTDYFKDLDLLGQPLPIGQDDMDFNVFKKNDYDFKFELGIRPEIEVQGFSSDTVLTLYKATVADSEIEEEVKNNQERLASSTHPTEDIVETDLIKIQLQELTDEGEIKVNGIENTTSTAVDRIVNEELKAQILTLKTGDTFVTNVYELDSLEPEKIRKYLLDVEEEDMEFLEINEKFQATIEEVTRQAPAEMNQEFFDKMFPDEGIETEEAFKAKIKERIEEFYNAQAEVKLYYDFEKHIKESNEIALPEDFLKRWMAFTDKNKSAEEIEKGFDDFKEGLKWSLLQEQIADDHGIEISEETILTNVKNIIGGYYGGMMGGNDEFLDNMAKRLLQSKEGAQIREQAYGEALSREMIKAIKDIVTLEEEEITSEDLSELLKKEQAERRGETTEDTAEVEEVNEEVAEIETSVEEEVAAEVDAVVEEVEEAVAEIEEAVENADEAAEELDSTIEE